MMRIVRYWFALSLLVLANSVSAEVFCVDTAPALQLALATAATNGQADMIKIVQGTYVGNFLYGTETEAYDIAVTGGWETGCANQVIDPTNTTLDGNQASTVLALSADGLSVNLYIKGLTLRNGKKTGYGGGLYAAVGESGTVSIEANRITGNITEYYGGGVYVSASYGSVTFINNTIEGSSSTTYSFSSYGGGVYVSASHGTVTFTNNTIAGNSSTYLSYSSAHSSYGGGVYVFADSGTVAFTNNTIEGNSSYSYSDYQYLSSFSYGGGVYVFADSGTVAFTNNTIEGNSSSSHYNHSYGGGVYVTASYCTVNFTNNTIAGNSSSSYSYYSYGGGVYVTASYCTVNFTNNTIAGNSSNETSDYSDSYGGGLYLVLSANEQLTGNVLYNNLFWNNISFEGADLWIENNLDGDYVPTPITLLANNFDQTHGTGYKTTLPIGLDPSNLNKVDPLFLDAANGDLHLLPGSPMIDAGYPATPDLPEFDIEGTPRVLGVSVDIGAYEFDINNDPKVTLSVTKRGTGTGTVTTLPAGINCGDDCAQAYDLNTEVALIGNPDTDAIFDGWSGGPDCADGQVTMDAHKSCTATFNAVRQFTVTKAGLGGGTVTSSPTGINCGSSCSGWFYLDDTVTLTPTPAQYSLFSGWSGDADCTDGQVTMAHTLSCTAQFDPIYYSLLVLFPGTGTGTVTSSPAGINCPTDCREDYAAGTKVTLTAATQQGSVFSGWAGACSGNAPTCEVTVTEVTGVSANFTALTPETNNTLYVSSAGGGTVTSSPAGINCGTSCDADFDSATVVTLTPNPNPGLTFNGWRGACSGTSTCQVPMSNDQGVMAAFGTVQPSHVVLLQQDQLGGTSHFVAPRMVVLGPALTVAAGSDLTVEAGEQIKILPGFKVEKGATFRARINATLRP